METKSACRHSQKQTIRYSLEDPYMTSHRKVFLFVIYSIVFYLLISILAVLFHVKWMPLQRINLISDIVTKDSSEFRDTSLNITPIVIENKPDKSFDLYRTPRFITNFNTDTSKPSLENFVKK